MKPRDIPNLITGLRILLVPPIVLLLIADRFGAALVLFILAGVSDVVDGFLARAFNSKSRLGGWLDPIADKSLQISVYLTLAWLGLIPAWLMVAVILRDLVIVTGGAIYYFRIERVDAEPSWLSKINTLFQILLVMLVLYGQAVPGEVPEWLLSTMFLGVLFTTVVSGVDYVWNWSRRAARTRRERDAAG